MNCKNCKLEDEYCASGDCPTSQSPRNDLATKPQAIDLTEKWRKGELPEGWYWVEYSVDEINGVTMMKYMPEFGGFSFTIIKQVLAKVPSYDEYMTMKDCAKKEFEAVEKYTKVKELLKECRKDIDDNYSQLYRIYHDDGTKIRDLTKAEQIAWVKQQKDKER